MALINLKFSPEMEELVLHGKKCCTTRDEPKGEVGDVFRVKDRLYRIVGILKDNFEWIGLYFRLDGFNSEDEYLDAMAEFYPDLDPESTVYIHFFVFVGDYVDNGS